MALIREKKREEQQLKERELFEKMNRARRAYQEQLRKVYYTRKLSAEITHASWGIGRRHNCTDPGHDAAHALRTRALPTFNLHRHSPR